MSQKELVGRELYRQRSCEDEAEHLTIKRRRQKLTSWFSVSQWQSECLLPPSLHWTISKTAHTLHHFHHANIPRSLMLKTPDTVLLVLRCLILFSIGLDDSPSEVAESICSRSSPSDLMLMGWAAVVVTPSFVSCSMVGVGG